MRATFENVRRDGGSLWMQAALIFQELLRVVQVIVPLAAIATALALTYYMSDNLTYTAAHHNDVKPHDGHYYQRNDTAKWGYTLKRFPMWFDNSASDIYNINRASLLLTAGLLCVVMNLTVIALLIKRRLVPNTLILIFDLILVLFTLSTYIYVRNVYQNDFIPWPEMAHAYHDVNSKGQHWLQLSGKYDSISWLCAIKDKLGDTNWIRRRDLCQMGHRSSWLVLGIFIGEACLMPIHAWFWHRARKAPRELEPEDKAELIEDE